MITIFETAEHRNMFFHDLGGGAMVQANQHIIVDGKEGMLLDPGGHKIYAELFSDLHSALPLDGLKHIVLSHQDPDIVAAINGWLMATTDTVAYAPSIWMRFIPHFGVDKLVQERILPVEDGGTIVQLNGKPIMLLPAHFLHSPGNLQVYDPISRILYSGDLGASVGLDYTTVEDFDHHVQFMEGFHRRYMPSSKAMKMWVRTVADLEIDIIAPQHGAIFATKEMVARFIAWVDDLSCGPELMGDRFELPQ